MPISTTCTVVCAVRRCKRCMTGHLNGCNMQNVSCSAQYASTFCKGRPGFQEVVQHGSRPSLAWYHPSLFWCDVRHAHLLPMRRWLASLASAKLCASQHHVRSRLTPTSATALSVKSSLGPRSVVLRSIQPKASSRCLMTWQASSASGRVLASRATRWTATFARRAVSGSCTGVYCQTAPQRPKSA